MAYATTDNVAVLRDKIGEPINFTCADGTAIAKGQLLKLTSPRTAIISSAINDMIAGICARDKVASNGVTSVSVFREGIFDMFISGTVAIGDGVTAAVTGTYPNHVQSAILASSGAVLIGTALEAGTNGQQIQIDLHAGTGGGLL